MCGRASAPMANKAMYDPKWSKNESFFDKIGLPVSGTIAAVIGALAFAHASTPEEWQKLDAASAKACIAASGFRDAKAGPSLHFSDDLAVDARIVSGVYPQDFMNGALGRMLCLYSRKSERAEMQEIPPL